MKNILKVLLKFKNLFHNQNPNDFYSFIVIISIF